nr:hypothetical protein [Tanacetum cinerariifolium]
MIKLRANEELKDTIMVVMPELVDVVKNLKNPRQATRGVLLGLNVVSNSNPFKALNSIENNDDFGTNEENSGSIEKGVTSSSISTTHIAERIDKFERHLNEGKLLLVDDNGKPLSNVFSTINADGDSEVEEVFDEYTQLLRHLQV